jgi:hypothetical protein
MTFPSIFAILVVIEMMFNNSIRSKAELFPGRGPVHVQEVRKVPLQPLSISRSAFTLLLGHVGK